MNTFHCVTNLLTPVISLLEGFQETSSESPVQETCADGKFVSIDYVNQFVRWRRSRPSKIRCACSRSASMDASNNAGIETPADATTPLQVSLCLVSAETCSIEFRYVNDDDECLGNARHNGTEACILDAPSRALRFEKERKYFHCLRGWKLKKTHTQRRHSV
jgi:hypothetical protein